MSEYEAQAASNQEHANHLPSDAARPLLGDSFKSLLAGAVGGTLEVCTDHPIDLIKVRLQTAAKKSKKSVVSMVSNIVRDEGVGGLYRGASIRIITLMPGTAISFWGLDIGKSLVKRYWPGHEFQKQQLLLNGTDVAFSVHQVCWAGAFSAIPVTAFATPSERIKCLLQIQQQKSSRGLQQHYSGPLDCARHLYRQGGLPSLYKGLNITLMRNLVGYSSWFGCYEFCKQSLVQAQGLQEASLPIIVFSGGVGGSLSWLLMIPFDSIKSRIQTNTSSSQISIRQAFVELTSSKEGLAALVRGWRPAVLIAFPANAACFLGMELAWRALSPNKQLIH